MDIAGFANKVAVVTGGGQGIGAACVQALAAAGARVALVDVNRATSEKLTAEHEWKTVFPFFPCDVGKALGGRRHI